MNSTFYEFTNSYNIKYHFFKQDAHKSQKRI